MIPSKWAAERFIRQLALVYADHQLKKLGDANAEITKKLSQVDVDQ